MENINTNFIISGLFALLGSLFIYIANRIVKQNDEDIKELRKLQYEDRERICKLEGKECKK